LRRSGARPTSACFELDGRNAGEIEIAFLGVETEIGQGIGRWLMNETIVQALLSQSRVCSCIAARSM
jgi:hypothetical protein